MSPAKAGRSRRVRIKSGTPFQAPAGLDGIARSVALRQDARRITEQSRELCTAARALRSLARETSPGAEGSSGPEAGGASVSRPDD